MKLKNPEIRIETTNHCNAHCITCPRDTMTRKKCVMEQDLFEDIILQACELGVETISLFGFGEPLMDPNIAKRVEYCSEMGFNTFLTTNASLLDTEMASRLLDGGLSHIRFSFHAITPDNYENVHRGLKYTRVIRNIQNFISKNIIRYSKQCKISVSVMPMHNETITEIREKWEKYVDFLEIWRPHNWGNAKEFRDIDKPKKITCGRPHRGPIQIQADGTIIPCCFLTNSELVLGDLHNNTIEEILKDKPYRALRLAHETGNITGYPCKSCDQLNIEDESPLLYSGRDKTKTIGCTSSTKFNLEENNNGINTE